MASLVLEMTTKLAPENRPELVVVPGISAVNACASLLGAPIAHDFAVISLSDPLFKGGTDSTVGTRTTDGLHADATKASGFFRWTTRKNGNNVGAVGASEGVNLSNLAPCSLVGQYRVSAGIPHDPPGLGLFAM